MRCSGRSLNGAANRCGARELTGHRLLHSPYRDTLHKARSGELPRTCRNRHCPQCQARQREAWRAARLAELLNVPYCHLVFTLPHELNALATTHARWVYETLMRCSAATLNEFAANARWLGGVSAFTLVLHTWTQDLRRHIHVHALMACGALRFAQPAAWVSPQRGRELPVPGACLVQGVARQVPAGVATIRARRQSGGRHGRDARGSPGADAGLAGTRLGGLCQDPAGRAGCRAGLPVALHAPHGHQQ
ncbi:MAG: transposase zinc-binding domain-containing protein [Burkholderiales bacterium]|nr:transposase zinc-binding domain-containing protein [Burkholderiales bacterium]